MTAKRRQAEDPADLGDNWVKPEPGAEPGDAAPDTNAEEAEQAADETDEEPQEPVEVVRWKSGVHTFQERTILAADLVRAGVEKEDAEDLVWNFANKFCIPLEDLDFLSQDQFDELVGRDPDLEVVTIED
jgi:hypothetical protein